MCTEFLPKDYLTLLKCDIPNGRDDLISTSKTLEDVAEHCLNIYDKSLETTVNYTAQALGSVAYKINLLATNFLEVLDHQNIKLNELQTKVNHLNMQVHIHQEKTARLSIGKYTMPRDPNAMRSLKNLEPLTEINNKYKRKEIDFTILDHIGHGVKIENSLHLCRRFTEPQLGGSSGIFSNTSRRSSTSGSDTHSSTHAYSQSNLAATLGPKSGAEYTNKFGKIQTIGRTTGISMINPGQAIYRAPGTISQKSQIPMVSPNLSSSNGMAAPVAPNYGNTMQYQQQMSQTGPRRSNSTASSATSGSGSLIQSSQIQQAQKQYQAAQSGMVSPHKMSVGSLSAAGAATGAYGYPGGVTTGHPMAHIPPPPPPVMPSQAEQNMQMRYNEFPPPPIEPPSPYQHQIQSQPHQQHHQNMGVLPPPPNTEQFQHQQSHQPQQLQQQQSIQSLQRVTNTGNEQINNAIGSDKVQSNNNSTRYMSDSVGIAHLQPTPYDVVRARSANDEPWAPAQYICKVVTLYEYQQNKDDELSFQENELIFVVKKNNDGWWEGVMNGRTGLFPGNYVQNVN